jgi:hypothetical protein
MVLGNLEGRVETGGEGSDANELFADITNGLRISGADWTEGQPNKFWVDFCFVVGLNDLAVGVPGREMGCILGGGGCCGVVFTPWFSEAPRLSLGRTPFAD